ncbi:MAG TPA: choice-of-anchor tandem repeat GloVer-containing protein, partial [Candidatus Acidoferrum sp.]|nr:choice-of-anchor tandem repeat GloVer-containing protein [Candidatus Acidoferrum sp.]
MIKVYRAVIVAFVLVAGVCACSGLPGTSNGLRASNWNTSYTPTPSPSPNPLASALIVFSSQNEGVYPNSDLKLVGGKLYGTTAGYQNFVCNCGTVYATTPRGDASVLHVFNGGSDGAHPSGDLAYANGTFYGVTSGGGSATGCGSSRSKPNGCGTLYSVTLSGKERVLHAFTVYSGYYPAGSLVYLKGKLYGTTPYGSTTNAGMVWSFDLATGTLKSLHDFVNGQADADGGLTLIGSTLYGATASNYNGVECMKNHDECGTVFSIGTDGTNFKVLHTFDGADGATPMSGLAKAGDFLYGTTAFGGKGCVSNGGCGTIYSIDTAGRFTSLLKFSADATQGTNPVGTPFVANGILYGATEFGGQTQCESYRSGCGAIYAFHLGSKTQHVLYSFNGTVGAQPLAGVVLDGSAIYGTTYGGDYSYGTLYRYQL